MRKYTALALILFVSMVIVPESFAIPFAKFAVYPDNWIGTSVPDRKMVLGGTDETGTITLDPVTGTIKATILEAESFTGAGFVFDHGETIGLLDDDHPQYAETGELATLDGLFDNHVADSTVHFTNPGFALAASLDEHEADTSIHWADPGFAMNSSLDFHIAGTNVHGGLTDHGTMMGLLDYDHPQYSSATHEHYSYDLVDVDTIGAPVGRAIYKSSDGNWHDEIPLGLLGNPYPGRLYANIGGIETSYIVSNTDDFTIDDNLIITGSTLLPYVTGILSIGSPMKLIDSIRVTKIYIHQGSGDASLFENIGNDFVFTSTLSNHTIRPAWASGYSLGTVDYWWSDIYSERLWSRSTAAIWATGGEWGYANSGESWVSLDSLAGGGGGEWFDTGSALIPIDAGYGIGTIDTPIGNSYISTINISGDIFTDRWLNSDSNTIIGVNAAGQNDLTHGGGIEGWQNTALGNYAMWSINVGIGNIAIGYQAGYSLNDGDNNVYIGHSAGMFGDASYNTGIGYNALANINGGDNNVALGYAAGDGLSSGNYNIIIGSYAMDVPSATGDNQLVIGSNGNVVISSDDMSTGIVKITYVVSDSITHNSLSSEPTSPVTGMVVWADGSSWNPGSGAGLYVYTGSAWSKLH